MTKPKLPRQDRGHERRNDILDAAACILVEAGERGLSMQSVAARAGASTGSMYHFFRNRNELIDALYERHMQQMVKLLPAHPLDTPEPWRAMSVEQLIDGLFGQVLAYLAGHPDAIILVARMKDQSFPDFKDIVEAVLKHRLDPRKADEVAKMLVAASTGTLLYLQNKPDLASDNLINRIPDILVSYLSNFDDKYRES